MELLLKIVVGAVAAALCAVVLRKHAAEFAVLIVLAVGVWVMTLVAQALAGVIDCLDRLAELAGLDEALIRPVIKVVGLSVVTRVAGEVCRGVGESGIAAYIEVAGTFLALASALPLVSAVVERMSEMLT